MSKKNILIMTTMCFIFGLLGCRTNYIHAYKGSSHDVRKGTFVFKMQGTFEDRTEEGRKIRILADPYSLVIRFLSDSEGWEAVTLNDLRLVSPDDEVVFDEPFAERSVAGKDLDGRRFAGFSFGDLKIPYLNYRVLGKFEILDSSGDKLESGKFDVILEKEYRKTKSSDLIDAVMGI